MTGNDIVDLATAAVESNWKRKGFLEKIFTPLEQKYIHEAVIPAQMVWKLWSMKESAYKMYIRQYGGRFFAPLQFNCTMLNGSEGMVNINQVNYHTTSSITKNYIYSIATAAKDNNILVLKSCFRLTEPDHNKQQEFIYKKLIGCYCKAAGIEKKVLSVIKDETGVPFLFCETSRSKIPVSITHHGNYAAFIISSGHLLP